MIAFTSSYPSFSPSLLRSRGAWLPTGRLTLRGRPIASFVTYPAVQLVELTGANEKVQVRLESTALTFGRRWWWRCPRCQRRCGKLYFRANAGLLACRLCCRLRYRTQTKEYARAVALTGLTRREYKELRAEMEKMRQQE